MMGKEGLIPVKKETANGHTQTYWEKSGDIRKDVGTGSVKAGMAAAESRGGDKGVMSGFFSGKTGWSRSSSSPEALKMRGAAAAIVANNTGRPLHEVLSHEVTSVQGTRQHDKESKTKKPEDHLTHGASSPEHIETIEAMSAVSQAMHDGDHVTLYRGIGKAQVAKARETGHVSTGSLVSFTEHHHVAKKFAAGGGR